MITISKAKVKESQKIRKLEQKIWKEQNITSVYEAATFVENGHTFIAKDAGKIIGAIIAINTSDNKIRVVDWVVDEKYRGLSIGERLYKRLIKAINNTPIVTLIDTKNKASINGHKKLGFKIIKKIKDPYSLGRNEYWFLMKRG